MQEESLVYSAFTVSQAPCSLLKSSLHHYALGTAIFILSWRKLRFRQQEDEF